MSFRPRLDEILHQATNRAQAVFLSVDILKQFLEDLAQDFSLSFATVAGNESRMTNDVSWSVLGASDNYDIMIHNMLEFLFDSTDIEFIHGDPTELIVNVGDQNVLLLHGNGGLKPSNYESDIQKVVGRYAKRGIVVDYVLSGHYHSAFVGDNFSRSSSLSGTNDYAEKGLNLTGRASQNAFLFFEDGNRDGIKIDLQHTSNKGYAIENRLEAYNAKSANKLKQHEVIFQVVI